MLASNFYNWWVTSNPEIIGLNYQFPADHPPHLGFSCSRTRFDSDFHFLLQIVAGYTLTPATQRRPPFRWLDVGSPVAAGHSGTIPPVVFLDGCQSER